MSERIGNGVILEMAASSPPSYSPIGVVESVSNISFIADRLAITYHGSTYKRYAAGMGEMSDVEFVIYHKTGVDEDADVLFDLVRARTKYWWQIRIPSTETDGQYEAYEFQAYVGKWDLSAPKEDYMRVTCSLIIDGDTVAKYNDMSF